mgnify:CR=1 FL=1
METNKEQAAKDSWFNYEHREGNLHQNCFVDGFDKGVEWKERQLPGVEECIAKAIEMGIEDIRDQFKELINFSQGKTI